MKLIVGLGNPGRKYSLTKHNIGFRVLDSLANRYKLKFKKNINCKGLIAQDKKGNFILLKPITYMNNSGESVKQTMDNFKINLNNLLLVYDDIDLPLGSVRFRQKGRSGGHKGVKSIIDCLRENKIARVKIGIGHPGNKENVADYVLSEFSAEQESAISLAIEKAADYCQLWIEKDN